MKQNSTIEQQNCKGHKKFDRFLVLKMEIIYPKEIKVYVLMQFSS